MNFVIITDFDANRKAKFSKKILKNLLLRRTGRSSSIGSVFAWHASGPEFDPHIRHILSWRLGHENISMVILPLPLIQEEQLSVIGKRMCTCKLVLVNCLGGLPRNNVARLTDRARNDLKCVEGP